MRTSAPLIVIVAAGVAALPSVSWAQPQLNRTPSRVVGQPSLAVRSSNPNVPDGRSLYSPRAVVVDTTSSPNAIYVSDTFNNRVLGWRNAAGFENGAPADLILGQLDEMSTSASGPERGRSLGFAIPGALAVDSQGSLYITDTGNNRILRFPKPFDNMENLFPNLVIGQSTFTGSGANPAGVSERTIATASGSNSATTGLAFDTQGNLWFTDALNNRVLRYPRSALDAGENQPAADLVLGQPDFRTTNSANAIPAAQRRLNKSVLVAPAGITVDSAGRVYVSDSLQRVVVYTPAYGNGKAAARLLGIWLQPPDTTFNSPEYVLGAPEGLTMIGENLVVADPGFQRVVRYDPFSTWPEETEAVISPPAMAVIGAQDFNINQPLPNRGLAEPTAATLSQPYSAFAVGTELYVADSGNNRVLAFPSFGAPASRVLGQTAFNFQAPNIVEGRELFIFAGTDSTTGLSNGGGLALDRRPDRTPHLYISDTYNNRILGYRDARAVRPGDAADIVIGQNDLNRVLANAPQGNRDIPSESGLFAPTGLVVDSNGDLYVADTGNSRVVRFPSPFEQNIPLGERHRINLVLGQLGGTQKFTDASPRNMAAPYGVALTAEGHIVVSDAVHHRLLFFRRPAGADFTTGMAAEKVVGQPDFFTITRVAGVTNRLFSPRHIAIDTDDRLYVTDGGNDRLLIFDRITTANNDPPAAFAIPSLNGVQGINVSLATGEIWVALGGVNTNQLRRFPRFERLALNVQPDAQLDAATPLALAQDRSGNLIVAEAINRVAIYFSAHSPQVAGSYSDRPLSPGSIASLFPRGTGVNFTTETVSFDSLPNPVPLPTELGGIQVLFNGEPARLYFVSPQQINFLVPMGAPDNGGAEIQVIRTATGEILTAGAVAMARVSPALFVMGAADEGQLASINQDGSINSDAARVARGEVISLFATGLGFVANAPPDGTPPDAAISGSEDIRVLIEPDFVPADHILYSGLAPGLVGVYQINVRVPMNVSPGAAVPVVVQSRSTNSNVGFQGKRLNTTIAVRE